MKLNFWDFTLNPIFEGTFTGCYRSVGAFKKPVYIFADQNKTIWHIWGSAVLSYLLYGVPFGSGVKITYKGKEKTGDSRYPVKLFELEITKAI